MEEMLNGLKGTAVFTILDLTKAYHQLEFHPYVRDRTGFANQTGVLHFKRCPLGLSSVPGAFQRWMGKLLQGLKGVQCFFDDVICLGTTMDEHDAKLKAVMHRLSSHKVQLNLLRCKLRQTSVSYLGIVLSSSGIKIDPDRTRSVSETSVLNSSEEL